MLRVVSNESLSVLALCQRARLPLDLLQKYDLKINRTTDGQGSALRSQRCRRVSLRRRLALGFPPLFA